MRGFTSTISVVAVVMFLVLTAAIKFLPAGGGCCAHCGCENECRKICRLVCEEKKVSITCWGGKTEDFCLPGPSQRECKHCETVCDEETCDPKAPCTAAKKFVWFDWSPSCKTTIHTKNKLMKKTVTKMVPSYKWVVEEVCCDCEQKCQVATVSPGASIPQPPIVNAKFIPEKEVLVRLLDKKE